VEGARGIRLAMTSLINMVVIGRTGLHQIILQVHMAATGGQFLVGR